ncbi:MAG: dihydroorotate dehydrogenase electron transfer subunit [Candidatus Omnitrophica bacterium]|jgi:dihydroorotate dehydrogenase electron transfer subunit|nr:dihydroorotate dehydrogenase electron transfer subunit [Candidatus Omnitrophota bacterium]MDD4981369.1 dihydroorotate dehydrogenase electron transfer subunit [Candidatus Omnitrophota bacterium]MDD5664771.1 dihydroorotate dehydrogenase electron transfer subunit [Candidatus Omnitrophota bacterium]
MLQIKAKITSNKKFKGSCWHCIVNAPSLCRASKPGQFLNVRISEGLKPFLRRPFSIHNIFGGKLEILYNVVGEGTRAFSGKKSGDYLDLIGPLGKGFDYVGARGKRVILIAGGIGVAPLLFLSKEIKSRDKLILIGARTRDQVLCEKEFRNSGSDVKISTDDGSRGFSGRVTDLLKNIIATEKAAKGAMQLYACGPGPMLKEVCNIAIANNLQAQVSLEEHMGCGIGACLGCVVKTKNGLKRVCKEGPVFYAKELIW